MKYIRYIILLVFLGLLFSCAPKCPYGMGEIWVYNDTEFVVWVEDMISQQSFPPIMPHQHIKLYLPAGVIWFNVVVINGPVFEIYDELGDCQTFEIYITP